LPRRRRRKTNFGFFPLLVVVAVVVANANFAAPERMRGRKNGGKNGGRYSSGENVRATFGRVEPTSVPSDDTRSRARAHAREVGGPIIIYEFERHFGKIPRQVRGRRRRRRLRQRRRRREHKF